VFLVDAAGYLTVLARRELSGYLNYQDRNHIDNWSQTITGRIGQIRRYTAKIPLR
jgi:putative transposase